MARLNTFWCAVIIVISLSFVACSKTAAPTGAGGATGPGTRGPGGQSGPNDKTGSSDLTGPGSLEDVAKNRPPITPPSSPLQEVYFGFDSFDLSTDARATLKKNADWLKANPSVRVEIEGHCDDRGTNEYNLALGAKRAQAAKDYLVSLGIPSERLSTISYGE